ncbi:MAG: tRNA (adenosine(37)-N6)-dimethylallyltransferase MiaA [Acholeplasmatales bacterium]|nr:tRNA (adenosine(37)-N6)-dimethylallyltransferase MiaA [Acholeplasmatales bacterium]
MDKVIAIVGPTAIGKTKISIELAKRLGLEIISGDSVAVYKGLDIGSAKPTAEEMQGVIHHLIDVLEPTEQYDVSMFQAEARKVIYKNHKAIICGGTGLYIQSAIYDYRFDAKKRDEGFEEQFKNYSNEELYNYLLSLDPTVDREKLHPNNRKRVLRAIEIFKDTNNSVSNQNALNRPLFDSYIIYLNVSDRDLLYKRIDQRVDKMIEDGLLDEVKGLYDKGIYPHAIGYKELLPYFAGDISLQSAVDEIKKNSRHLAKRQMTWFRNQMPSHFYEVNINNIDETIDTIYNDLIKFLGGE